MTEWTKNKTYKVGDTVVYNKITYTRVSISDIPPNKSCYIWKETLSPNPKPNPTPNPKPNPTPSSEVNYQLSFIGLTQSQTQTILKLTSIFENSTTTLQYNYVENIGDGRGYTFGFVGFCSGTGDGSQMLEEYSRLIGNKDEETLKYIKVMKGIDAQGKDMNPTTVGLENFPQYVKKVGNTTQWIQANLNVADKLYIKPSQEKAISMNIKSPLIKGQLYDCYINQGEDGALALIKKTGAVNGDEPAWLKNFLKNRYDLLISDPTWGQASDRILVYQKILKENPSMNLDLPIKVTCYGDNYTIV